MSIIGQPNQVGSFGAQTPGSTGSGGLTGILGKIFGGAGGQDSLLNSLITSGLGAGAGAFLNTPTTVTRNETTTPNLDPTTLGLRNSLVKGSQSLLGQDPNLSGYRAEGLSNINAASKAQNSVLNQTLASRGLSNSPLASAEQANLGNNQFKQSVDFQNQIPLLRNQLLQQKLANVTNTFRSLPYGQSSNIKQVTSGNMIGGALAGLLASMLSKKPKSPGGGGGGTGVGSGGGSPQQQILQQLYPDIFGLPYPPYQNPPFPPQDPSGTPDISSGVTQYDPNNIFGGYGAGTAGWTDPATGMQLPGAPPYDPGLTDPTYSGINFSGGNIGDGGFGGFGGGFSDGQMMEF